MRVITRNELEQALQSPEPPLLLEALPAQHFEAEHLPGAYNLPLDEVDTLAQALIPRLNTPVVTYCSGLTCPNSKIAAKRLEELGYTDVSAYEGGKEDWLKAGLPFEN
jgi:rhodanese-related sulfurtransferase